MPFALGMVRKLASEGHQVFAADDQSLSPGNHSRYLAGRFVYPSPRRDTAGFLAELEWIAREHEIDVIVPTFEEAFYISTQLVRLSRVTEVFVSPFRTLACLHDKGAFERLVARLGLPVPETVVVRSGEELSEATGRLERYFARAVFSRGGVGCLTNTGPLAGALEMDEVHPTPASPWVVQAFVEGETVCTYSTVHGGRVSTHLMYRIPRQRKHSTGIQFEAIDATESLRLIEPIVAELGYTGQISFDFLADSHPRGWAGQRLGRQRAFAPLRMGHPPAHRRRHLRTGRSSAQGPRLDGAGTRDRAGPDRRRGSPPHRTARRLLERLWRRKRGLGGHHHRIDRRCAGDHPRPGEAEPRQMTHANSGTESAPSPRPS